MLCECLVDGSSGGRCKQVSVGSHQIPRTTHCTIPRTPNTTHEPRGQLGHSRSCAYAAIESSTPLRSNARL